MRTARLFQPIIIVVVTLSAGCASLDQPLSELPRLSLVDRPRWRQKIQDDRELAKQFIACSARPHSGGEPGDIASQDSSLDIDIELAPAKLVDRALKRLDLRLKNDSKERPDLRAQLSQLIEIDREKIKLGRLGSRLKAHLADIDPSLGLRRYAKLLAAAPQLVEHLHARIRDDEDRMVRSDARFERLLVAYNRAYFGESSFKAAFGGGHSATGPKGIKGDIRAVSDGFVDRNGTTFAFPGLSANLIVADKPFHLQSGSADSRRVASDLTRIFFEALFDAAFQVPAIEGATALKLEGYPQFDLANSPISADDLAKVTTYALRTEAAAISRVGEFVRGGGGLGINNETLASVIETAAGVTAKKLAEHELFCYYQVRAGK